MLDRYLVRNTCVLELTYVSYLASVGARGVDCSEVCTLWC